jgi:hypothetical protein
MSNASPTVSRSLVAETVPVLVELVFGHVIANLIKCALKHWLRALINYKGSTCDSNSFASTPAFID